MSEIKLISPLLDDYIIGEPYSDHHGVCCLPAMKNNFDTRYILKVISIPASQVQLQAFLLTGIYKTEEEAKSYFADLVSGVEKEISILSKLSKLEGFVSYEGYQVVEKENEPGFDIYLLGTYKRSLERHFRKYPMTHLAAVNLGLDMCAALAVCRQAGHLYIDLKPGNIFTGDDGEYRIGDLGFLDLNGLKFASIPDRYRSSYSAPELSDPFAPISDTADIYAAGLILYQAYNGGVLPFEGNAPAEVLQPPMYADYEMSEIILKACAPDPKERWEDPIKMGQAIVSYMQRNGANDTPIVPPTITTENTPEEIAPQEEVVETEPSSSTAEKDEDQLSIEALLADAEPNEDEDVSGLSITQILGDVLTEAEAQQPVAEDTEVPSEEIPTEEPAFDDPVTDEAIPATVEEPTVEDNEEDVGNLAFLDDMVTDETAPSDETVEDVTYNELSEDANSILAQVDDLIAHETPAPAVAPEPVEVDIPEASTEESAGADPTPSESQDEAPAADEEAPANPVDETVAAISQAVESSDGALDNDLAAEIEIETEETSAEEATEEEAEETESNTEDDDSFYEEETEKPKGNLGTRILTATLILIIAACIAVAGYLFYRDYYMKTIDVLTIDGVDNQLTVSVKTDADHSLLSVICTDAYGNKQTAPLLGGSATFTDLASDSLYKVTLEISGFHGLKGTTTGSYTTAPQTEIMSVETVAGAEAGTVIVSFTVNGHDTEGWVLTYSAPGEQERTHTFTGHMTTITDLTVGVNYSMTLDSEDNVYVVGQNKFDYASTDLIFPTELKVTELSDKGMTITWSEPEGIDVEQWTVLCYNDAGFSQNQTTAENSVVFTDLDPSSSYTVEVTASGMSVGSRVFLTKNTVSVQKIQAAPNGQHMDVVWEYAGAEPTENWVLTYTVDEDSNEYAVITDQASARIEDIVPGTTYTIKLRLEDGTTVLNDTVQVEIPAAKKFEGYNITADNMTASMCVPPAQENWKWSGILKYADTFTVGEKAGFILRMRKQYDPFATDPITTLFVIRDAEGKLVSYAKKTEPWNEMWLNYYCELTISNMPQVAGEYTIELYFNSALIHQQGFTIQ